MNPPLRTLALPFLLPLLCMAAPEAPPAAVAAARVRTGDILRPVSLPGSLRANRQVLLVARVPGYVASLTVDRGDRVKAGQVLAEIEVPELLADRKKLEVEVRVAETTARRLAEAAAKSPDLVSPLTVDEARGRLESARAALEKNLTLLGFARITAPFDGVITQRHADPGAHVAAGTGALLSLMDDATVRAVVPVPEAETSLLRPGQPVRLLSDALPGRSFDAVVSRFGGALDEATRTLAVEADVPNPDGLLRPGMYVMARIGVEKHTGVRLVPAKALVMEKTSGFVFRAVDGRARKTPVKTGFQDGVQVEILDGVAEGDLVLLIDKAPPADGQAVNPVETP